MLSPRCPYLQNHVLFFALYEASTLLFSPFDWPYRRWPPLKNKIGHKKHELPGDSDSTQALCDPPAPSLRDRHGLPQPRQNYFPEPCVATVDLSSPRALVFCRSLWLLFAIPTTTPVASQGSHSVVNLWIPYGTSAVAMLDPVSRLLSTIGRLDVLPGLGRDPLALFPA